MRLSDLYPLVGQPPVPGVGRPLEVRDPLHIPTVGGKGTAAYLAHSYPTKVPPEAIAPYLRHHTRPGDLVLDPFCGSGMTGVAARESGRHAVLNDLSVGAVHLASNMTAAVDPVALRTQADKVLAAVRGSYARWYRTEGRDGEAATIDWTLWSEQYGCPRCGHVMALWDVAVDRCSGKVASGWACPRCAASVTKRTGFAAGAAPAWMSITDSSGRYERAPSEADLELIRALESRPVRDWYPKVAMGPDREMYVRCALQLHGIEQVADFWTARNLRGVARLWREIGGVEDLSIRQTLAFAFTNTVWHATRMRRYNARGGQRPLTGTLYIPQLSIEVNPANVFANKIKQLVRFYTSTKDFSSHATILRGPAQALSLPDASIDYCFTDPPFGANIFYADCAIVWESWLGEITDTAQEAVVNRSLRPADGGKTVDQYADLMAGAFTEIHRVLKPDAWTTIVFNSSDPEVWAALRIAVESAGFDLASASHIDKTQQSFKGYKGRSGREDVPAFDIVLNAHKPGRARRAPKPPGGFREAGDLLAAHLASLPAGLDDPAALRQRTLPYLHSLLVQAHFNGGIGLEVGSYALVRRLCERRFDADKQGRYWARSEEAQCRG
ncbi:MAG: DNA methyltransferase [Solirubrobacteraceae bacterium]